MVFLKIKQYFLKLPLYGSEGLFLCINKNQNSYDRISKSNILQDGSPLC